MWLGSTDLTKWVISSIQLCTCKLAKASLHVQVTL